MADSSQTEVIDQARLEAGQAILDLTDRGGFDARAAGWLRDQSTGTWRYLLVTPMLTTNGPKWVYERLVRLFRKLGLPPGLSPLDIHVIDEAMEMAAFGALIVADEDENSAPRIHMTQPVHLEGFMVADGHFVFLRRLPEATRKRRGNPAKTFDETVQRLAA